MQKKVKIICLILVLIISLSGCMNPIIEERKPSNQITSMWESEDGSIQFHVARGYEKTEEDTIDERRTEIRGFVIEIPGTMVINGEIIEFCAVFGSPDTTMELYPMEYVDTFSFVGADSYGELQCKFKSKRHFVATVEKSTYLEEGQKIHFYRTYPE